jgi:hypothetical protein
VRRIGITAQAVAVIATVAVLVRRSPEATEPLAHHRFTIPLPDAVVDVISPEAPIPVAQISPDGKRVAFTYARSARLASRIWIQRLDDLHAEEVMGSEGAWSLFWSPDSQQLGFFAPGGAVKKFTVSNGTVQTLCEPCAPAHYDSGTWSRGGLILFPSADGRLLGLRDGGGEPEAITSVDRSGGS